MRGKAMGIAKDAMSTGITPAYAGKSDDAHSVPLKYQDHPRLCGEKVCMLSPRFCVVGSPPPMRGKVPSGLT